MGTSFLSDKNGTCVLLGDMYINKCTLKKKIYHIKIYKANCTQLNNTHLNLKPASGISSSKTLSWSSMLNCIITRDKQKNPFICVLDLGKTKKYLPHKISQSLTCYCWNYTNKLRLIGIVWLVLSLSRRSLLLKYVHFCLACWTPFFLVIDSACTYFFSYPRRRGTS